MTLAQGLNDGISAVPAHAASVMEESAIAVPARMRRFGTSAAALIAAS
jgi:hypothetical protein